MGRRCNSGLCTGVSGQMSSENYDLLNKIKEQARKYGVLRGLSKNYTKEELLSGLRNVTEKSTEIVKMIEGKKIKLSVIGDELFERYLGADKNIIALQIGNNIYVRKSSETILSDIVHEGTHAIDHNNGISSKDISSIKGEIKAYTEEYNYQRKKYGKTTFSSKDEIIVFVHNNYK